MSKSQRTKGASYEREVAAHLSTFFYPSMSGVSFSGSEAYKKFTRNLSQTRDGGNDIDVGRLVVECKRRKSLKTITSWLKQAQVALEEQYAGRTVDATTRLPIPVVVMREDKGESMVLLTLDDFLRLAGEKIRETL